MVNRDRLRSSGSRMKCERGILLGRKVRPIGSKARFGCKIVGLKLASKVLLAVMKFFPLVLGCLFD